MIGKQGNVEHKIRYLNLDRNYIREIKFCENCPDIEEIQIRNNLLKEVDLRPLGRLSSLKQLLLCFNPMSMVYFPTNFNPISLKVAYFSYASSSFKFSSSILREDAPLLKQFYVEGSLNESQSELKQATSWLLKGLQKDQILDFCDYLKKINENGQKLPTITDFVNQLRSESEISLGDIPGDDWKIVTEAIFKYNGINIGKDIVNLAYTNTASKYLCTAD